MPLELNKATIQTSSKNHFVTNKVTSVYVVPGSTSSVRVPSTSHFVLKNSTSGGDEADPNTFVNLKKFTIQKDNRTLPIATAGRVIFGGVKSETASDESIPITFKKYGVSSYEVVSTQPLLPGEYVFSVLGKLYCFGIDAS